MIDYYCNHISPGQTIQLIDLDQNTKELGTVRKEFKIEKNPVNGETVFTLNNQYEPLTKLLKLLEYNQVLVIKKEQPQGRQAQEEANEKIFWGMKTAKEILKEYGCSGEKKQKQEEDRLWNRVTTLKIKCHDHHFNKR